MANPLQTGRVTNDDDKRYFPRWAVENRVLYQLEDKPSTFKAHTKDLSCAGACLSTHEELLPKTRIKLTVFLSSEQTIYLQGIVCWTRHSENSHSQVGVTFENVPARVQEIILDHAFELNPQALKNQWFKGWEK